MEIEREVKGNVQNRLNIFSYDRNSLDKFHSNSAGVIADESYVVNFTTRTT